MADPDLVLRLVPGADCVGIGTSLFLRNDLRVLQLRGPAAVVTQDQLLPALRGGISRSGLLSRVHEVPQRNVLQLVDLLLEAGLVFEETADEAAPDWAFGWTHLVAASVDERRAI